MHRTTSHFLVTILVLMNAILSAPWISRLRRPRTDERGDVPGWVLITVMTAGRVQGVEATPVVMWSRSNFARTSLGVR